MAAFRPRPVHRVVRRPRGRDRRRRVGVSQGRAADGDRDWPAYAGDKASTKYSPLDQINAGNVKNLTDRLAALGHARGAARAVSRRAGAGQLPAHAADGRRPALHEQRRRRGRPRSIRRPARPSGSTRCRRGPTARGRRAAGRRAASPTGATARTRASSPTSAATSSRSTRRPASATPTSATTARSI